MFRIEITTLPEFLTFARFIQGKELDIETIKKLTHDLNLKSDTLIAAVETANKED